MSNVNYKSTRLLVETINQEMDSVRKAAMRTGAGPFDSLNELRDLVAELAKRADRVALEDVPVMEPAEYVATMKPLVAEYHRQLAARDLLPQCLCEDLRVNAVVVVAVGDERSVVRAAHDPRRPDAELVVDTLLTMFDAGTKKVVADAAGAAEVAREASPDDDNDFDPDDE